ncbi:undecaprenyl-galactosyl transferase [Alcaligenes faecalis subsp. faecalis NCIB 8687]|nr:undecaprenyl-galactosyl transferase [Alcaligenes faecalis subsp. faecalis NCIB 8687]
MQLTRDKGTGVRRKTGNQLTRYERRHSRWYEIFFLGAPFQLLAGLCLVLLVPAFWTWGIIFWRQMDAVQINTIIAIFLAFTVVVLVLRRLARFSGGKIMAHIAPIVTSVFFLAFAILFFARLSYSRPVLLSAYGLSLLWCYAGYFIGWRYRRLKFALLPMQQFDELVSSPNFELRPLVRPDLEGVRYDGVVADLQSLSMTPEWERFLAQCILAQIPVFHVRRITESLTGRVCIDHLSENEVGALLPSPLYSLSKRFIDIAGVLVVAPFVLPVMVLTALAVRLDSPGPALFTQNRVGLGNRDFRIYKFRSMSLDAEAKGARLAAQADDRITRVGAFIRKTRLDELPQLWNVLKGDMSLIGPRPEQRVFVDQFEVEIPFYIYRHVVRPGITGWAQVKQGYADDVDSTKIKIQHDFYYIKHFSLWLDVLIVFKTIKVIFTGGGAR